MGVATGCGCKEVYRFPHTTSNPFLVHGHTRGVTGDLTRHVYEWHEPVLLNRYKRERNPAQSTGQASATILLSQTVKKIFLHTYIIK